MDGVEGIKRERHFSEDILFKSSEFGNSVNVSHTLIKINDDAKESKLELKKKQQINLIY